MGHTNANTTAIITCFSYVGNDKYIFNPNHLRTDLRRILRFILKTTRCPLQNIYVLTDLVPSDRRKDELVVQFKQSLEYYLRNRGYRKPIISYPEFSESFLDRRVLDWIRYVCREAAIYLRKSPHWLYDRVIRQILPRMDKSNSVEIASLLTNFILINGSLDYDARLRNILNQASPPRISRDSPTCSMDSSIQKLFFYYTGHGIRHLSCRGEVDVLKDICLVIPDQKGLAELYSRADLRRVLQIWPGSSLIVFDCCRAESLVELPFKISFNKFGQTISGSSPYCSDYRHDVIYLASTRHNQTCGFCGGIDEYGSLFTYYLINFLERIQGSSERDFNRLYSAVEEKIQSYRAQAKKPFQNMSIQLNRNTIKEFPGWLFGLSGDSRD